MLLVDARESMPRDEVKELKVSMMLDDRPNEDDQDASPGTLTVQINMESLGLLGKLDRLVDTSVPGFELAESIDQGVDVTALDAEGNEVLPKCTRSWSLKYVLASDSEATTTFAFPEMKAATEELKYERFADADIVEVDRIVEVASVASGTPLKTEWIIGAVIGLLLLCLIVWMLVTANQSETNVKLSYESPTPLTPFNLVSTMKRMADDPEVVFRDQERASLLETIQVSEERFFANGKAGASTADLTTTLAPWVELANRRSKSV